MSPTKGYAAHAAHEPLRPFSFARRALGSTDVELEILFCGVCHSDLHILDAPDALGMPVLIRACRVMKSWDASGSEAAR